MPITTEAHAALRMLRQASRHTGVNGLLPAMIDVGDQTLYELLIQMPVDQLSDEDLEFLIGQNETDEGEEEPW